jgi:hypothetical protein
MLEQTYIARGPKYNRLYHRLWNISLDQFNYDSGNKYSYDLCDKEDHFVCNCPDLKKSGKTTPKLQAQPRKSQKVNLIQDNTNQPF